MREKKKYTMLVVDDEAIISDGLKELFEEEFSDIFQIYNCYHPKKALEIFKYRMPDVVVSDVKMPKMSGIEMAEEMRKIKPDLHVLFLSGYDEFDFVYSAIKQDADDYILKTEGDGIIVQAMKKMTELLDSENLFMEEYKSAQSKISYMAPAFKQQALVHILDGTIAAGWRIPGCYDGTGKSAAGGQQTAPVDRNTAGEGNADNAGKNIGNGGAAFAEGLRG